MLTLKNQQITKISVIALSLVLILFSEPTLAGKTKRKSTKSNRASQTKQSAPAPKPAPKVQQSSNASRARSTVTARTQPMRSQSRASTPKISSRNSIGQTSKSRTLIPSQSSRRASSRSTSTVTSRSTTNLRSRIAPSARTPSSSTIGNRKSITVSYRAGKQTSSSQGNRISSSITSRIGSSIGKQTPSVSIIRDQPTISANPPTNTRQQTQDSRGRKDLWSKILGQDSEKNQSLSTITKPSTTRNTNRINRSKTQRIGSEIRKIKTSSLTAKQQPTANPERDVSSTKTSRIGSSTRTKNTPVPTEAKQSRTRPDKSTDSDKIRSINSKSKAQDVRVQDSLRSNVQDPRNGKVQSSSSRAIRKSRIIEREPDNHIQSDRMQKSTNLSGSDEQSTGRISRKAAPQEQQTDESRIHRYRQVTPSYVTYHDRPHLVRDSYHHQHTYYDCHHRIRHRTIWPRFHFILYYNYGPWSTFRYCYPFYHRKYVFVSLGGYWPWRYRYIRYYWYGYHPYYWCGYYPIAREVQGDTYNYYTYNYYNDNAATYDSSQVVDADIYEKLGQQDPEEPAMATLADSYFEEAIKAFEASDFDKAVEKFAKASELAPEDMVLPFAYCQALFANQQYTEAAKVLRTALEKVSPEKEGVFYPRGLYPNEQMLLEQLDLLAEKIELYSFDADLQLLLGYQLLGIGQTDKAVEPLLNASGDLTNADAAAVLLRLLEKIKASNSEAEDIAVSQAPAKSKIISKGQSTKLRGTMLLATLCVLVASTGIRYFTRC